MEKEGISLQGGFICFNVKVRLGSQLAVIQFVMIMNVHALLLTHRSLDLLMTGAEMQVFSRILNCPVVLMR